MSARKKFSQSRPWRLSFDIDPRSTLRASRKRPKPVRIEWPADLRFRPIAFVAFYLADLGWDKGEVGLALSAGTVAGLIAHLPGGALVDWVPWKRGLAAIGIVTIATSALILRRA